MSSTPIHDIVREHAIAEDARRTQEYIARHVDGEPHHLHMSGLDRCVRQAYLSTFQHAEGHPLQRPVSHPFGEYLLRLFELGRMYEDQTYRELCSYIPINLIEREPALGHGAWSGKPDFVIQPCERFPDRAVIDCKATGSYQFAYTKGRIPRLGDCLQVLAYQRFLQDQRGVYHPAHLYYRQWHHHAEFKVWEDMGEIHCSGDVDGHPVEKTFYTCLKDRMYRLEAWWKFANDKQTLEASDIDPLFELPGFKTPFADTFGCLRYSREKWWSSCRWLSECWSQFEPGDEGPFEKPQEEEDEEEFF